MSENYYTVSDQQEVSARLKEITGIEFNLTSGAYDIGQIREELARTGHGGMEAGHVEATDAQIGSQKGVCLIYYI